MDQYARVYLNGVFLGEHKGGYEPFSFDVTEAIGAENLLEVRVEDDLESRTLPYGKQREKRGGMWYTPVTGIWQTVWLESVCEQYVASMEIKTHACGAVIKFFRADGSLFDGDGSEYAEESNPLAAALIGTFAGAINGDVTVKLPDGGEEVFKILGGYARISLDAPRLWSPEDPFLYEMTVRAGEDRFTSYFAIRTLDVREIGGIKRLCLNGKPYFFHGVLDQGYFSDGLFLPADPRGYERDILAMKELGFNTLRKHIKLEPERFYYDCDRLGMVVFQDMVNNGSYSFIRDTALPTIGFKRKNDSRLNRRKEWREAFVSGMESTVRMLSGHPCICYWTIFNEGWGQFNSGEMYEMLKSLDSTRFIDTTSGWFFGGESDVDSQHVYFKPVSLTPSDKPSVLSEFGGYTLNIEGHVFNIRKSYGYKTFLSSEALGEALTALYEAEIIPAARSGLCASIYTQLSDVEDETNGLLTYDRRVTKVTPEVMRAIASKLSEACGER